MDVDGDGQSDLDPSRIFYMGTSLGGGYGTVFVGVEPSVKAGVLVVPTDPIPIGPLGVAQNNRPVVGTLFASRQPSLLNAPGIKVFGEVSVSPPFFDDNMPLRDQIPLPVQLENSTTREIKSPVSNVIAGALEIQATVENYEWVSQAGSPLAYAPHLRRAPLRGMPARLVLFEIAKGDQSAPNPTTTAILRAGQLADRCVYLPPRPGVDRSRRLPGLVEEPAYVHQPRELRSDRADCSGLRRNILRFGRGSRPGAVAVLRVSDGRHTAGGSELHPVIRENRMWPSAHARTDRGTG